MISYIGVDTNIFRSWCEQAFRVYPSIPRTLGIPKYNQWGMILFLILLLIVANMVFIAMKFLDKRNQQIFENSMELLELSFTFTW